MEVDIHLVGGGKVGGGVIEDGGICQAAPEQGRTLHR